MRREEVLGVMARLASNWTYFPGSEATAELWIESFADTSLENFSNAAEAVIASDANAPTIARMRQVMREQNAYQPFAAIGTGEEPTQGAPEFFRQQMSEFFATRPRSGNPVQQREPNKAMQEAIQAMKDERAALAEAETEVEATSASG